MPLFVELSLIFTIATLFALLMRLLKQPLLIGYILTGILVGPRFFNLLHSMETIDLFSKIGIAILLFIVGVNLRPQVIREVGKSSVITGLAQVLVTSTIGFGIARLLGFPSLPSLYLAVALTFGSTIIILKILSDKGDLHSLYGKVSLGFLLVQDLVVVLLLAVASSLAASGGYSDIFSLLLMLFFKGLLLTISLTLISRFILARVTHFVAVNHELLFLFSIAWGMAMATVFQLLGFSIEIGALVAGITLSATDYSYEIGSRLKPLRDFFIILFFIALGSQLVISNPSQILLPTLILSTFVLVGNPIIVLLILHLQGYTKKVGLMSGMTVSQISEFSLILVALGLKLGHLDSQIVALTTLVGIVTITGSTYLNLYSDSIYRCIEPLLVFLKDRKSTFSATDLHFSPDIILFGYHRAGPDFLKSLSRLSRHFLIIDYNPEVIDHLKSKNIPHRFGDAADSEFIEELNLHKTKLIISTIPDRTTNLFLLQKLKQLNSKLLIILTSANAKDASELYSLGANYVIVPHYLGAKYAARMLITHHLSRYKYRLSKIKHLAYLRAHSIL